MGLIYYLSDMTGIESTAKSEGTINTVIKKTIDTTNEVGLTKKNPNSPKVKKLSEFLDYPLRKLMHMSEYFILTLLVINALYRSGVKRKIFIYALIFSFAYACTDEFHQLFRERTSSILDVLIDTIGSLLAILLIKKIIKVKKIKH